MCERRGPRLKGVEKTNFKSSIAHSSGVSRKRSYRKREISPALVGD